MLQNVAVVVGDHIAAFELGVISEVFGLDRSEAGLPGYDFAVCAVHPGLVPTTSGYRVEVEYGLERLASADLIAVPAWSSQDVPPPELVAALQDAVERGSRVLAVCSGAFLLAAAGLLDGRRAATHWQYAATLAQRYPAVRVDADVLYVEDGPVITSAGTAAAIDACLHLVRQTHGATVANALARRMVVPPHRSGGQAQYVQAPVPVIHDQGNLTELIDWAQQHLAEPLTVDDLAGRALMSSRTFARRFKAVTGTTPHRWLLDQRLLLAEDLLENTELNIGQIASRCGLGSPDTLRHHFTQRRRTNPSTYRRTFHTRSVTVE